MDPQIPLFRNFFIKNGSHDIIHTFKNYFVTVFSISIFSFSNNKLNPNRPITLRYKIITYSRVSCNFMNNFHNDAKTLFFFYVSCKFNKSNEKKEAEDLIHYFKPIVPREVIHKIKQVYLVYLLYYWTNPNTIHGSQLPHQEIYSMFRLYNQPENRSMGVFGRERKGEVGQNERDKYLEFNRSQVLSKTHSRPNSKWHVQVWKLASTCNSIFKSIWVELESIWSPYVWISMQCTHHVPDVNTFWDINVPEFHVLEDLP